jgi:four helix bundle protein
MRARTETFAVAVLKFTNPLMERVLTRSIADQVRRSATSTAQNYSACTIAKSRRDFISKLRLALEEADESARWLRMLRDADLAAGPELPALVREATELAAILGASCATAERNNK